jgi:hypothetical protein
MLLSRPKLFPLKIPGNESVEAVMKQCVNLLLRANAYPSILEDNKRAEFSVRLARSNIEGAGNGVYLQGRAAKGTVVALYAGKQH